MSEITKTYSNKELTVIWKPQKCIHSGVCVTMLPEVYHPDEKPWITPDKAGGKELIDQISQCPSGALTYTINERVNSEENVDTATNSITIKQNGPLLFKGVATLIRADGTNEVLSGTLAFCRCGASENKPYCDGSHRKIKFNG